MVKLLLQTNVHAVDDTFLPLCIWRATWKPHKCFSCRADVNAGPGATVKRCCFRRRRAAQGRGKNYETYLNLTKMLIAKGV